MEYIKNQSVELQIEDLGNDGEGIGKIDGYPFFVKDALPGDVIRAKVMKAKKNMAFARLEEIVSPSENRISPICPYARKCGGCQIMELSYPAQLAYKEKKVKNNLLRIGSVPEELLNTVFEGIIGIECEENSVPIRYRNKAQFPFGKNKEGQTVCGFYAGRTHAIVANTECYLGVEENQEILEIILSFMEKMHIAPYDEEMGEGLIRHALIRKGFQSGELMVCLVINGDKLPGQQVLVDMLQKVPGMQSISISVNKKNTNVIMGDSYQVLWGAPYITDTIGEVSFQISPLSFYQVNPVQTKRLYETALSFAALSGSEVVWDLYCGIGTISLFLAQKAKQVYGVEIVPQAIEDAKKNAQLNGFANASFFVGKAEEVLPEFYEKGTVNGEVVEGLDASAKAPDVIVVDPPRKGCDEACLSTMVSMKPDRIVYVSCDSATLARDVKYLREHGYELERVKACDMFPNSVHVETVCLLSKKP